MNFILKYMLLHFKRAYLLWLSLSEIFHKLNFYLCLKSLILFYLQPHCEIINLKFEFHDFLIVIEF